MRLEAAIDVGTNSVLLLVAGRGPSGLLEAVLERVALTRLGRGVDATKRLAPEAIEETLAAVESFAQAARGAGARAVTVTATSAARDAINGRDFLEAAQRRAGAPVHILSGDEEARLTWAAVWADFGGRPLVLLDVGGGSTEFVFGDAPTPAFRHSFDVGSVRLTERLLRVEPPQAEALAACRALLSSTFAELPPPPGSATLVAVAGTATTLCAVSRGIAPYDAQRVHGAVMRVDEVRDVVGRLAAMPLDQRRALPGLEPRRADVIVAGGLVVASAMEAVGAAEVTVSDRGLRWGVVAERLAATTP